MFHDTVGFTGRFNAGGGRAGKQMQQEGFSYFFGIRINNSDARPHLLSSEVRNPDLWCQTFENDMKHQKRDTPTYSASASNAHFAYFLSGVCPGFATEQHSHLNSRCRCFMLFCLVGVVFFLGVSGNHSKQQLQCSQNLQNLQFLWRLSEISASTNVQHSEVIKI